MYSDCTFDAGQGLNEHSTTATATLKSNRKITLVEVGPGATSSLQKLEDVEARAVVSSNPQRSSSEKRIKTQPKDSLPQIRELDRILQAQDGDALRRFVLLGSPAWQKSLDNQVRQIEANEYSVIEVVSTHVDGNFVRVGCNCSVDGQPLEHPATFDFVKRENGWKMLVFFVDDNLDDLKKVLSAAEWNAVTELCD